MQKPSIGRIVHYRVDSDTYPAVIVFVHDDETVDLFVMMRDGSMSLQGIKRSDAAGSGGWSWPPYVKPT